MVDAETVINELNIDDTPETETTIKALIVEADAMIRNAVDRSADQSEFEKDPIYRRCLKSLVTQLWYDRTLNDGMPIGIQMMITHLQSEVDDNGFHYGQAN